MRAQHVSELGPPEFLAVQSRDLFSVEPEIDSVHKIKNSAGQNNSIAFSTQVNVSTISFS